MPEQQKQKSADETVSNSKASAQKKEQQNEKENLWNGRKNLLIMYQIRGFIQNI